MKKTTVVASVTLLGVVLGVGLVAVGAEEGYQVPVPALAALVDAPESPDVEVSPDQRWLLLQEPQGAPTIAELSRSELRLAGLRIDPRTNGASRRRLTVSLRLLPVTGGEERVISGFPEGGRLDHVAPSPDSTRVAFTVVEESCESLWIADVASARAKRLLEAPLNGALGAPCSWLPDSSGLLCRTVPAGRPPAPSPPQVPSAPLISETAGRAAPVRTYQDLLATPHDADLFEYLATSQLVRVGIDGRVRTIGEPAMIDSARPSPSGSFVLVETVRRPFSYLVPVYRFPRSVEVWDMNGKLLRTLAKLPLAEAVPVDRDAVRPGPREYRWRQDVGATVVWVEAQDGGDPGVAAEVRDRLLALAAPFDGQPVCLASLGQRFDAVYWASGSLAVVQERWWKTRRSRIWVLQPDHPEVPSRKLFDLSSEDRYADPGDPLLRAGATGGRLLYTDSTGKAVYLSGKGASPEGDRPFLDAVDTTSGESRRLWRSQGAVYEEPITMLGDDGSRLLTLRESPSEPPNVVLRELGEGRSVQLTHFPNPTPALVGVSKELIRYQRADGVELTATLYLPQGKSAKDGPLPTLVWAYPREFKSAGAASQVRSSPYRFVRVRPTSPLAFLAVGYAVLDDTAMPIVGEGERQPNDTYVSQLVASAAAAVDELVHRGVSAPGRIAIGGHSYGAFMAANLLANSDLFAAGIARSGAYNRTLTPFSFQAEERTLWQAPEVYIAMSPFMRADKVNEPILLLHGEADNNAGTFPMQSERFFAAIKGLGGTARLVVLPHEAHGYRGRESLLHMLWEMHRWLELYVNPSR